MARKIDIDAIIYRIRMEDQSSVFAGDPSPGYSWLYTITGSSPHGGLYLEKDSGEIIGPFVTGVSAITDGWMFTNQTWTYESSDDPTYTFTIEENSTGTYSRGMRLKLDQSTGGTKHFILTDISFSGSSTTVTVYGGTDYDLENERISNPYYSIMKAPFGFPLSPIKWTEEASDTTLRSQATPVQNTWYNLGSFNLSIPIGIWKIYYMVVALSQDTTATNWSVFATLSTANNSESDVDLTCYQLFGNNINAGSPYYREKYLDLSAKTTYYLNTKTGSVTLDTLFNRNSQSKAFIRAVCTYL